MDLIKDSFHNNIKSVCCKGSRQFIRERNREFTFHAVEFCTTCTHIDDNRYSIHQSWRHRSISSHPSSLGYNVSIYLCPYHSKSHMSSGSHNGVYQGHNLDNLALSNHYSSVRRNAEMFQNRCHTTGQAGHRIFHET